jgi:uncharacterized protein
VSAYLDASVIVPLFLEDTLSQRADALIATQQSFIVADWAVVEVSGVMARQARIATITPAEAQAAFAAFDQWRAMVASPAETTAADMQTTIQYVRRTQLALRGPDALHIAIASRLGAKLLTFDAKMAAAATALGVETVS